VFTYKINELYICRNFFRRRKIDIPTKLNIKLNETPEGNDDTPGQISSISSDCTVCGSIHNINDVSNDGYVDYQYAMWYFW